MHHEFAETYRVNFVEDLSLKQDYEKMPNGYWGLSVDDMSTKIYPFKKFQGAVVRRLTRYSDFSFDPIDEKALTEMPARRKCVRMLI